MNVTSPAVLLEPGQISREQQDLYGIYANNVET